MADIEKSEPDSTLNGQETGNFQPNTGENSETMLKPWLKNVGKDFYQNEELAQYDSLKDALTNLLKRPKAKDVPESYGEIGKVEEAYRKAGLTADEAKEITAAFSERMPKEKPDLKDYFKDDYGKVTENYRKGVDSFADDALKKAIADSGLDKDPAFVDFVSRVGKETGQNTFEPPKNAAKKDYAQMLVENKTKR